MTDQPSDNGKKTISLSEVQRRNLGLPRSQRGETVMVLDPTVMNIAGDEPLPVSAGTGEKAAAPVLTAILKSLRAEGERMANRISFESDPTSGDRFGQLYKLKSNLIPDHILKMIAGPQGDDLVCAIVQARSNVMSSFGRPKDSRFAIGFEFVELKKLDRERTPEEKKVERERVSKMKEIMWNCGPSEVDDEYSHPTFSQLLKLVTRDGLVFGRMAVERIFTKGLKNDKKKLVAWRSVDAGTIYRVLSNRSKDQTPRVEGLKLLEEVKNERLEPDRYLRNEYKHVQVVDGRPIMAFTEEELVVYNIYPVTNVEYNGYPLTPIDQTVNAITTHINIAMHNRMYFQHGRAARGMLTLQSDTADESVMQKIRLQFHQSINSAANSWRMPAFLIGEKDKLDWTSIDVTGRDAEFQYLSDSNARVLLSAFQMSPEELPGYAHLARGTNSQALSESDNEYKLIAARSVGLRPLILDIQDFFNNHILPFVDEEFANDYQLVFTGLDQDSPEKESTRLAQDIPLHMTINDVLRQVEKRELPAAVGGDMLLNPQFQQVMDAYLTVGQIQEYFFKVADASKDPREDYRRDPFWLQWQQILVQKAQLTMQMQMAAQQQAMQPAAPGQSAPPPQQEQVPPDSSPAQKAEIEARNLSKMQEWMKVSGEALSKAIRENSDHIGKVLRARHEKIVKDQMKAWSKESREAMNEAMQALKD